jgi:hypothetical protein
LWVFVKSKRKLHAIQWYKVNIPIPKGRNGSIERRNGTKARPKPSRKNIKYCSSMSSIQDTRWQDAYSNGLGKPCPYDLAVIIYKSIKPLFWAGSTSYLGLSSPGAQHF